MLSDGGGDDDGRRWCPSEAVVLSDGGGGGDDRKRWWCPYKPWPVVGMLSSQKKNKCLLLMVPYYNLSGGEQLIIYLT